MVSIKDLDSDTSGIEDKGGDKRDDDDTLFLDDSSLYIFIESASISFFLLRSLQSASVCSNFVFTITSSCFSTEISVSLISIEEVIFLVAFLAGIVDVRFVREEAAVHGKDCIAWVVE